MIRHSLILAALSLLSFPALAGEAPPVASSSAAPPSPGRIAAPTATKPPQVDLSRSVSLTGHEMQTYVQAQVAAARAQDAAEAAQGAVAKVRDALTVSEPAK